MPRILVLTPAPTPYRDPFWAVVAKRPGTELSVCYLAKESRDRPWRVTWARDFPFRELAGYNFLAWRGPTEVCYWNPEVSRLVVPSRCDALILGGYNHPTLLAAMWHAQRRGIPFFVMSESHLRNRRPAWKSALKAPLLRWITPNAAGLFPTGTLAAEYFRHYGAVDDKMAFIPNVPDVEALSARAAADLERRDALRARWRLAGKQVVLFVGRLIPKKGVHTLMEACSRLPAETPWVLAIVGEGTFRPHLEQLARSLGIADRLRWVGFVQPQELPDWYLAADAFVLPSSETWGVAALEALACGLPVVVSDQTGCGPDVLPPDEREDGVFPYGDAAALAERLAGILHEPAARGERLASLRGFLSRFHYAAVARRMAEAVERAVGREVPDMPGPKVEAACGA